jgi:hypothetical protein
MARRSGAVIGGLLNMTFGNAAEFTLALFVLQSGRPDVVKATITGSILGIQKSLSFRIAATPGSPIMMMSWLFPIRREKRFEFLSHGVEQSAISHPRKNKSYLRKRCKEVMGKP